MPQNQPKQGEKNLQGITVKKDADFSEWYQQVIIKTEMIEYGPVSGCMVIRPYSYAIWEKAQKFFDTEIKAMGVKNAYFPLLIPESLFNKEKEHVAGFSPEVAWVTQGGDTVLPEKLAIRPTSETIMYDSYKKWIRSHRDLPLKLNQWANIVRWEFKHPVPFLRTREFLWQEGHTVYATSKGAEKEVFEILDLYEKLFQEIYAVPVFKGVKSEKEKFAGAVYTTSVETMLPNGKAIQGATSHFLGQNFSKAFDISFLNEKNEKDYGWQNSWGFSTRSIGIMLGIHGDDKGLILPPRIAPIQTIIIPIMFEDSKDKVLAKCREIQKELDKACIIAEIDETDYKPGWKFNQWEMKGVPVRVELGPKDLEKGHVMISRRDTGEKVAVTFKDVPKEVNKLLDEIQVNLFNRAKKMIDSSIVKPKDMHEFERAIESKKLVYVPFCDAISCEDNIKDKTGSKSLNRPLSQKIIKGDKCIFCGKPAKAFFYFGKSY